VDYYQRVIGLALLDQAKAEASLGVDGRELLVLAAARDRVALVGLCDHFVSEAIYLSDPDARRRQPSQ